MSEEQKKIVEELEKVRLEIFRNAADLDYEVRTLNTVIAIDDKAYLKAFVENQRSSRNAKIRIYRWDELDRKEQELWQKLIETF